MRQPGLAYRAIRRLCTAALGAFYPRIEVRGLERVPVEGGLVVVANHPNGLVDPMAILATFPRRVFPISKATLFPHPIIGPFLKLLGAIPVYRREDANRDPAKNAAAIGRAAEALRRGGSILIFPEGVSQAEPVLQPLRRGAARMALAADASILPVGLVFHRPGTFREGWAFVIFGEPLRPRAAALDAADGEEVEEALTETIHTALRRLIVEARDRATLRLLESAEELVHGPTDLRSSSPAELAEWRQAAMRAATRWVNRDPDRLARLERNLTAFVDTARDLGIEGAVVPRRYSLALVARYAVREGAPLVLGLPLAAVGLVANAVPYLLTQLAVLAIRPDPVIEASVKIAAGVVLYPVAWGALAWMLHRVLGGWIAPAAFLALALPSSLFALAWSDRWERFRRDARGFFAFLGNRDLHARLVDRRAALKREIEAMLAEG